MPETVVKELATLLIAQNKKLSCAESCTGGLVAKLCTDLPGSSAWFDRGFVTYSNQAKQEMLSVPEAVIVEHGAVSVETVQMMAQGALQYSHADYALAISGIAGPEGGSVDKPVGTVYFGFASADNVIVEHRVFQGDRQMVRLQSALFALETVLSFVK